MRESARLMRSGLIAGVLVLLPAMAAAQEGIIAGVVRDSSDAVLPGVTVEVSSPALIEKTRTTTSDGAGSYRITNLPVGSYTVVFTLEGFNRLQRDDVELTTGFTAVVSPQLTVGRRDETIVVRAATPVVDVQNARQAVNFRGEELRELPTAANIASILALTPGITSSSGRNGSLGGVCSGGAGVFCSPIIADFNAHASGNDTADGLRQGRIMIDGVAINSGVQGLISGMTAGYTSDITAAREVNIQISGALGESETGGASINIVPQTGGNVFKGTYSTMYTRQSWFSTNNGQYPTINVPRTIEYDYNVSGTYGGPIKRNRLWFFAQGRDQGKRAVPIGGDFFYNANAGVMGANYLPDRPKGNIFYKNTWRNGSGRFTLQASPRHKFNVFWDEQDTCQDPCDGVVSVYTSPESWWSVATHPNRLRQASWTHPRTNRMMLEAGVSVTNQVYDLTQHRYLENPQSIPRVTEFGDTSGADSVAARVNGFAGNPGFGLTSGSLNSAIGGGGAEQRQLWTWRSRASASYITGRHNVKIGYEGGYFTQDTRNQVNDQRLSYRYDTPAATCVTTLSCGNTSLYYPSDPNNLARRPIPTQLTINTGPAQLSERAWFGGFYAQEQWTRKRLTLSGALRYDHAASRYGETCVGPDTYVITAYCVPAADGVSFHDITPRWGATYDLRGDGKTAVKWNMGKYLAAAGLNDVYTGASSARRTVNSLTRTWTDANGNRVPECDLLNFTANGECGAPIFGADPLRYGRSPASLDDAGQSIGLTTTPCGRTDRGIPAAVQAYCNAYGETLVNGWGRRRNEWQFGLGVQHEVLPRLSAEVTYNRRSYGNLMVTDTLGLGCDRFNGAQGVGTCLQNALQYSSAQYDFYTVTAPTDASLPGGGGYRIRGLTNPKTTTVTTGLPAAQTLMQELEYSWAGVDTNFVWRGPGGLRMNGGTSTGRALRDTCATELDAPNVKGREGHEYLGGCKVVRPFQTRINGSARYQIPKIDVLISTVFQYQPGVERSANLTVAKDQVAWEASSASRAGTPCTVNGVANTGCFVAGGATTQTTTSVNLLDWGELYGEGVALFDLKAAKTLRFNQVRINVGVDVYNLFNTDAITGYNNTYTAFSPDGGRSWVADNPATAAVETNAWGTPTGLVNPRFARLSVQIDF